MNNFEKNQKILEKYQKNSIFFRKNAIFIKNAIDLLEDNERIDDLQIDGHCVIQNPNGYCFTSDSVLLANFCKPKSKANLLELCAGCGVISILLCAKNKIEKVNAVELQTSLYNLCRRNFEINNLPNQEVFHSNLKDINNWYNGKQYDCVVCNPPYEKIENSFLKTNEEISIARSEKFVTFNDIASVVSRVLKFGGSFCFLLKAERLNEIFTILKEKNLEPKELQFIHEKVTQSARLVMCKAVLGGKNGIKILPPIIRNNEDGSESEQVKKIYNRA